MQHSRNRSEIRIGVKNDFPLLKPVSFFNKPSVALAKVQINRNATDFEPALQNSKQLRVSFSHKRIFSSIASRPISRDQFTKTNRKFSNIQESNKKKSFTKRHHNQSHQQLKKQINTNKERNQNLILSSAKVSNKSIGTIKAYAVNSHSGIINPINEDRVCIITNMNRASSKGKQISFFGVFDAKNGAGKAQYYRDFFHNYLLKDQELTKFPEKVLKRAYEHIEKGFTGDKSQKKNISFTAVIIYEQKAYFMQIGAPKIIISEDFGHKIFDPFIQAQKNTHNKVANSQNFRFKSISIDKIDYITLGSEGLFQHNSIYKIGKKIWKCILSQNMDSFHVTLGLNVNKVMSQIIMTNNSNKNVSMILISFQNLFDCCKQVNKIELPYIDKNRQNENENSFII